MKLKGSSHGELKTVSGRVLGAFCFPFQIYCIFTYLYLHLHLYIDRLGSHPITILLASHRNPSPPSENPHTYIHVFLCGPLHLVRVDFMSKGRELFT